MSFIKGVADAFRHTPPKDKTTDRFSILSPLLVTGEYVKFTKTMAEALLTDKIRNLLTGRTPPGNALQAKAVTIYQDYLKSLGGRDSGMERKQPLSSFSAVLDSITGNLNQIEDGFQESFGNLNPQHPEKNIRASSLLILGYMEKADNLCTWFSQFVEHLTADRDDLIPPFRYRQLTSNTGDVADFAALNLNKWNSNKGGLMTEVKSLQVRGNDLPIQSESGQWIDTYAHDNQFNSDERIVMTAALRNPILIMLNWGHTRAQYKLELLAAKKEWLTAKLVQQQAIIRNVDENSPEYKRIKQAVEKYASLISKYEQRIERIRG